MKSSLSALDRGRSGIALIVVLGFLAVLVIMAVAFVVSMRTERLAAKSYVDVIRARQMLYTAVTRSVADIESDSSVWGGFIPNWAGGVFESQDPSGTNLVRDLVSDYGTNYVPGYRLVAATNVSPLTEWLTVEADGKLVGRYGYVAIDSSGLYDINRAGDGYGHVRPRALGASVYEPQLGFVLPEAVTAASRWTNAFWNATNPVGANQVYGRIETVAELTSMLVYGFGGMQPITNNPPIANLFFYSRFPSGYWDGSAIQQPVLIGNEATIISNEASAKAAFVAMGLSDTMLFDNLIDYVDSDIVPGDGPNNSQLTSFCTEPVPMINEIVISNRYVTAVSGLDTLYNNEYQIWVELWYPFMQASNYAAQIQMGAQFQGITPAGPGNLLMNATIGPQNWSSNRPFVTVAFPSATTWHRSPVTTNAPFDTANARVTVAGRIRVNGSDVDQLGGSGSSGAVIPVNNGNVPNPPSPYSFGATADDPRINWNGASTAAQWRVYNHPYASTLSNLNANTTFANAGSDGATAMYVRNGPIQVPGELGLLLYDRTKPWQTIPLLGATAPAVLDRFTTWTNAVMHGLVNINSDNTNVLGAIFNQIAIQRTPGDQRGTLTANQARSLGSALANMGFTNVSDVKFLTDLDINSALTGVVPPLDKMERESLVRNTANLFSTRQNIFTIFVAAQAVSDVDDDKVVDEGEVMAEQRAVAVVWRDPFPDSSGYHRTFIRHLKWLTE